MSKNTSLAGYLRSTENIVLFELQILLANILYIQLLVTPQHEERESKRFQNGGFQVGFWLSCLQRIGLELESLFINVQVFSGDITTYLM